MKEYSISKYRPDLYDGNGCYLRNEWTSFWEIGRNFYNGILSEEEYLKIEQRYIDVAVTLARLSGCSYLIINHLECENDIRDSFSQRSCNKQLLEAAQNMKQGLRVSVSSCSDYLRLCIREFCWAVFSNKLHDFSIDFGYDFYMHVKTSLPQFQVKEIVSVNNLYIRP